MSSELGEESGEERSPFRSSDRPDLWIWLSHEEIRYGYDGGLRALEDPIHI